MARRAWPGENPIGKRIRSSLSFAGAAVREVVGVVGDVRQAGLQDRPQPAYYVPHRQVPFGSMTFIVRTSGDPSRVVPSIQRAIWSLNPSGVLLRHRDAERPAARHAGGAAVHADAAVGILARRDRARVGRPATASSASRSASAPAEIGIRLALGAGPESVVGLVMRQGMTIALAGLAAGVAASLVLTRYLGTMLFGVTATDPVTYALLGGRGRPGQRRRLLPARAPRDAGRSARRHPPVICPYGRLAAIVARKIQNHWEKP